MVHARPPGLSPDEAYLVGLLHDIGRFVLFQEAPEQLREIDESGWDTPTALLELEKQICGLDHAELGALACRKWGIPETIAETIALHHRPPESPNDTAGRLSAIVNVADLAMFPSAMARTEGYASADIDTIDSVLRPRLPVDVAMSAGELHDIIIAVTEEADTTLNLLGLG